MDLEGHLTNLSLAAKAAESYIRGSSSFEVQGEQYELNSSSIRGFWEAEYFFETESEMYEDALRELDEGDVVYDIGANLGFFSCLMARNGAEVYSFEPDPDTAEELRSNLERNRAEAAVFEYAISNKGGEAELETKKGPDGREKLVSCRNNSTITVNTRRIDDLEIASPDIVKIDTEGHETQVLEGMEETLAEYSPLLYIEAHGDQELSKIREELGEDYEAEELSHRLDGNYLIRAEKR